jgi:hypothetical protein
MVLPLKRHASIMCSRLKSLGVLSPCVGLSSSLFSKIGTVGPSYEANYSEWVHSHGGEALILARAVPSSVELPTTVLLASVHVVCV